MTLHMTWTITGTVDDIYRPGAITAAADATAGEYMTSAPVTVELDTPLADVARTMLAYGIRHLPVVVAGEVIGMVSARDLLEERATTA